MKKKEETVSMGRTIQVDVGRLSKGLALTFQGVTAVFESLGADEVPGFGTAGAVEGETAGETPMETTEDKAARKPAKKEAEAADEAAGDNGADNTESKPKTASEEPDKAEHDGAEKDEKPACSAFTLNDIMKIAAQKMARDAKVTEKIGALVKTYGVATLKELPEEKFEAFMTDLTEI